MGGHFGDLAGAVGDVALWDGSTLALVGSANGDVLTLASLPNGDVVAGGNFTSIGGIAANRVARWDGIGWNALGVGTNDMVATLMAMPNGDVVAGGMFFTAGGVAANHVARWDGAAWFPLGAGTDLQVHALARLPNGDVAAGGAFAAAGMAAANHVARWDGASWSALGTGVDGTVQALTISPNGDLIAGGMFTMAGGLIVNRVARWNGASWSALASGVSALSTPAVYAIAALPNGDVVAGGYFTSAGGVQANHVARWNGSAWSALGSGVNGAVYSVAFSSAGQLAVGGNFQIAGGLASKGLARFVSPCPAMAAPLGLGCSGSGGINTLTLVAPPWVDSTFRAQGSGLPTTALVVAATSFTPIAQGALPLVTLFAQAPMGCDLLVVPDLLQLYLTTTGSVESSFFLPNAPPIVGISFFHQLVPLGLDALGNVIEVTSTNALQLIAGSF